MTFGCPIRSGRLTVVLGSILSVVLAGTSVLAQQKPQPAITVDLKPLGAASDLFTDQSDSKYQQRGVLGLFWLADNRIAVAFSANPRWTGAQKTDPLRVHLLIFDSKGKQLNERAWIFGAEGPEGEMTLGFAPGPDDSILAIHESPAAGKIPEGNFIQVLNPDTTRRQDFYVPSTSAYLSAIAPEPVLVLQTFYADRHSSLAWWSGRPLKPEAKLDLPRGNEETVVGPEAAARALCANSICVGIHVFRPSAPTQMYGNERYRDLVPVPRAFLSSTGLLVEMRQADQKPGQFLVMHENGTQTELAALPNGLQVITVSSIARDGRRFSVDAGGEVGLCGGLDLWCKQRGLALVFDIPANRIIFQQEIAATGGISALSPDGNQLAIFDRDKLTIYELP